MNNMDRPYTSEGDESGWWNNGALLISRLNASLNTKMVQSHDKCQPGRKSASNYGFLSVPRS